jgi:hypothetical protein
LGAELSNLGSPKPWAWATMAMEAKPHSEASDWRIGDIQYALLNVGAVGWLTLKEFSFSQSPALVEALTMLYQSPSMARKLCNYINHKGRK